MKKFLKVLLSLIALLSVLTIVVVVYITLVINPNDYKPEIVRLVKKQTGRELTLTGDLHLTFFPWLGIELGQASLNNPHGFAAPAFASTHNARIRLKLFPLLQKRIEADQIQIEGMELVLIRYADGRNNWDDLLPTASQKSPIFSFYLSGIHVKDAKITWDDQQNNVFYELSALQLQTNAIQLPQPFTFNLNSAVVSKGKQPFNGQVALTAQVTLDPTTQRYQLNTVELTATVAIQTQCPTCLPEMRMAITVPQVKLDNQQLALQLSGELSLAKIATVTLNGEIQAHSLSTQPQINLNGKLQVKTAQLPLLLQQLQLPALPEKIALRQAILETHFAVDNQTIKLRDLQLQANDNTLTVPQMVFDLIKQELQIPNFKIHAFDAVLVGEATVQTLITQPTLQGTLELAPVKLRTFLQQWHLPIPTTADPKVLQSIAGKTRFQGNLKQLHFQDLWVKLDDTILQGSLSFVPQTNPQFEFKLALDTLDLDRYLPPKNPDQPSNSAVLPMEQLRKLYLEGLLQVGKLKVSGIEIANAQLKVSAQAGQIKLTPQANLYEGSYQGEVQIDTRNDIPIFTGQMQLVKINVQSLLKKLAIQTPFPESLLRTVTLTTQFSGNFLESTTFQDFRLQVDKHSLEIPHLHLNLLEQQLKANTLTLKIFDVNLTTQFHIEQFLGKPRITAQVKIAPFNLRTTLLQLGHTLPAMQDNTTLTRVALETDLQGEFPSMTLQNLTLQVDESQLQGDIQLHDFATLATTFNLHLNTLNVDRYLPPPASQSTGKPSDSPKEDQELLPIAWLRSLQMNGTIQIAQLQMARLKMNGVKLQISAKEGKINILPQTNLYQGTYHGQIDLTIENQTSHLAVESTLQQIQIGALLSDLMTTNKLSGTTEATFNLHATANTLKSLKNTLSGALECRLSDGTLQGVNLGYSLRQLVALLKEEPPPAPEPLETDFSSLRTTFSVTNGVFHTDNLAIKSPWLRIKGNGQFVLPQQTVDLLLQAAVVDTTTGQGGAELETLKGITIPLKIQGQLPTPTVTPDASIVQALAIQFAQERASAAVEKEKDRLLEKHGDKIDKKVKDLLKDLKWEDLLKK